MNSMLWRDAAGVGGVVMGALPSKSNQRRIVRIRVRGTGRTRPLLIRSREALLYEGAFIGLVEHSGLTGLPLEGPLSLETIVYQPDNRRDLDIALFQDCLQRSGVIRNDRQIVRISAQKKLDKRNPRVEFRVHRD